MKKNDPSPPDAQLSEMVIPKENALFWMDGQGHWHNRHGRFEHKRIIDYFNHAIRRDENGYFVTQMRGEVHEKVYFHYADTPIFIVQIITENPLRLALNTGETLPLDPAALVVESDQLYHRRGDERFKFTDRTLMAIVPYLEESPNGLSIRIGDRTWPIPNHCPPAGCNDGCAT